ncbi:hypothetical protein [Apocheima cinerarium nucleopolyhedrovirus]|uniref:hypothetical protein n=1 Tax=Apocheima cinerarium nucleopolyhedrovirus TaxID=307461 RepID=UPI0001D920CB|nr:hypothetical protein [Apocheima cinerarium nucleopolyhedrovirus]ADB84464.1 hypothetical protein [Apocheima cinerarium nucleopolyhedrovirus]
MPTFYGNTQKYNTANRQPDVRQQYNQVMQVKRQLEIQSSHLEKLKRITKDPKEAHKIETQLQSIRNKFLNYGVNNF